MHKHALAFRHSLPSACLLSLLLAGLAHASGTSGVVFDDLNRDGNQSHIEPGIPDVFVSNGTDVVRTDELGRFRLACNNACVLFVIKPAGYRLPAGGESGQQFFYVHNPEGSPELRYGGQRATGQLPSEIKFALWKATESDQFRMLVFGDPQPATSEDLGFFETDVVAELRGVSNVSFGLSLGDLVGDDLSLFKPLNQVIASIGVPWFNLPGNHDVDLDAPDDQTSDDTYEAVYGPTTYAFQYGRVHFIAMDNILFEPGSYKGGLTERQFTFLQQYLSQIPTSDLVVLAMHIPLVDFATSARGFDPGHRERLLKLLIPFRHTLSLSAHTHQQWHAYLVESDGWTGPKPHHHYNVGTTSGSWWSGPPDEAGIPDATMQDGTPNGYAYLDFDGVHYQIQYRAAREPESYQMRLHTPAVVRKGTYPNAMLYANVFVGSDRTVVSYRVVGQTSWAPMNRAFLPDPTMAYRTALRDRSPDLLPGKRIGPALVSRHLWSVGLPTHLPPGRYDIEVRAETQWGQVFLEKTNFRIAQN